jgi:hypothetical protein
MYNLGTTVNPYDELLRKRPYWGVFEALEGVERVMTDEGLVHYTAVCLLRCICEMAEVFLQQDAAAMWILHPERRTHPIYHIDMFL